MFELGHIFLYGIKEVYPRLRKGVLLYLSLLGATSGSDYQRAERKDQVLAQMNSITVNFPPSVKSANICLEGVGGMRKWFHLWQDYSLSSKGNTLVESESEIFQDLC